MDDIKQKASYRPNLTLKGEQETKNLAHTSREP